MGGREKECGGMMENFQCRLLADEAASTNLISIRRNMQTATNFVREARVNKNHENVFIKFYLHDA